ncbi:MAG: PHB depolymerase family esterase [Pseudomonadota bacterium]
MKFPFSARASSVDLRAINETIQRALETAGINTSSGPMHNVAETITRALASAGTSDAAPSSQATESAIDVVARVVDVSHDESRGSNGTSPASFETHEFRNHAGTRSYKVYVPAQVFEGPRPMVVMLHGCTQSVEDFAAGTRMNRLAAEHGFLVVYPEQAAHANPSRCWNWFNRQDQVRDSGEPSLLAGVVREVAQRHRADPRRIFVVGLSAGAAMAVVLGETYPELFAGVGAHSGLPYGSAHDIPSALAAMKGARSGQPSSIAARNSGRAAQPVPTIVFHGDRDHTVHHRNATEIVKQAKDALLAREGRPALTTETGDGIAAGGRSYSRTVYADGAGKVHIESWTLHGGGHAWSGGDPRGSYTDSTGPDASREMVRFFFALPRTGSA